MQKWRVALHMELPDAEVNMPKSVLQKLRKESTLESIDPKAIVISIDYLQKRKDLVPWTARETPPKEKNPGTSSS